MDQDPNRRAEAASKADWCIAWLYHVDELIWAMRYDNIVHSAQQFSTQPYPKVFKVLA